MLQLHCMHAMATDDLYLPIPKASYAPPIATYILTEPDTNIPTMRELLVCGYTKSIMADIGRVPFEIMCLVMKYLSLSIIFKDNIFDLTCDEQLLIISWFANVYNITQKSYHISSELFFTSFPHKRDFAVYHKKIRGNKNLFTIIKTNYDHIFGCYTSRKLSSDNLDYGAYMIRKHFYV